MHPRFQWLFTLLAAMCLALGVGSCDDAGDSPGSSQAGGAGGPGEEDANPAPPGSGDGGAGGPEEEGGDTPVPTRSTGAVSPSPTSGSIASACVGILGADEEAVTALDDFARRPEQEQTQETRDEVAASFDEARARVRDYLEGVEDYEEPLLGPVRDAAARLLTEQTAVRDALLAGSPVILDGLRDARAALEAACEGV